uniref:Uncharacterized protein n=1 Tax=Anguilla anguilla TaxID=7936 RepID=A0A0E9T3P2_ANGAN
MHPYPQVKQRQDVSAKHPSP